MHAKLNFSQKEIVNKQKGVPHVNNIKQYFPF